MQSSGGGGNAINQSGKDSGGFTMTKSGFNSSLPKNNTKMRLDSGTSTN